MKQMGNAKESDKVYRKVGNRYIEVGYSYPRDMLTDGIWYVRTKKYSRGITNGNYLEGMFKICDKPICNNFAEYCDLEDIVEHVLDDADFREAMNKSTENNRGWSINDIVHWTLAVLKKKANEQKEAKTEE